ncbi:MAG: Hint domain-containing protein [Planktomarina sp.]
MPFLQDVFCFATGTSTLNNSNTVVLDNVEVLDTTGDGLIGTGDTINGEEIAAIGYGSSSGVDCDGNPTHTNGGMFITTVTGKTYFIHKGGAGDEVLDTIDVIPPTTNTTISPTSGYFGLGDDNISFCCFTNGTSIKTTSGEVFVEDLRVGDLVMTLDHGCQPIRWIGTRKVNAQGNFAPIRIKAGTLGAERDLIVSPQHRMLLQGWQASVLFGETEVLATAKSMINDNTIRYEDGGEVEYYHILFDGHEIVWANGALAESFHPGEQGMSTLEQEVREEIYELFPELQSSVDAYGPSARLSLTQAEVSLLNSKQVDA